MIPLAAMLRASDDPRVGVVAGTVLVVLGCLALKYHREIGEATGYYWRGMFVDRPTPGCLVAVVGVVFLLAGAAVLVGSMLTILGF